MPDNTPDSVPKKGRKWMWWLAASVTACIVLGAAAGAAYVLVGRRYWTDDRGIRRPAAEAKVRQVLWAEPKPLDEDFNTADQEYEPSMAADGSALYFVRGLPGKNADIHVSYRGAKGGWGKPQPVREINTSHDELGPRLTPDGRFLMFYSDRPGGQGQYDIWAAEKTPDGWGGPFNLGPAVNSKYNEYGPSMDSKGRRLYFATNRKAAAKHADKENWRATIRQADLGDYDLFAAEVKLSAPGATTAPATSQPTSAPAEAPAPLAFEDARELDGVNTPYHEGAPCVAPGGDFLYFASNRPGGYGGFDLYRCRLHGDRCGQIESLGPEINTDRNEADPQLAMGGFEIYFSSDREGSRGGYDLFASPSHEVYAVRSRRPLPALGWSWWALLIAMAALIPLLLFLRAAGYKHLNLLQKCVVVSLLFHIGLTIALSLWNMSQVFIEYIAREAGMTTAVNLELAREVEVKMQVRHQITDLPVADRSLTDLGKVAPAPLPRPTPSATEVNVPRARVETPSPRTVQPEAPLTPPPVAADRVSLPPPVLFAEAPRIRIEPQRPIATPEERPKPVAPQPAPPQVRPTRTEPQRPARQVVQVAAEPARPKTEPLTVAAAADRPVLPVTENLRPQVQLPQASALEPTPPEPPAAPAMDTRPDEPVVTAAGAKASKADTASPRTGPGASELAVPSARVVTESRAVALSASPRANPEAPKVALDLPTVTEGPEIKLPEVANRPAARADERPVVPGLPNARPLTRSPLSAVRTTGPKEPLKSDQTPGPVEPQAKESLAELAAADAQRPRAARIIEDRITPPAPPIPLSGDLGPGRLTAPPSLFQRSFEQRQRLIHDMGGSKKSEAAVSRALVYLADNQESDGRWTAVPGDRRRRTSRKESTDVALTGLAALCFLAADHTPAKPGPHRQAVAKSLDYLLDEQKPDGDLRGLGDMYCHAIGTLALAEAAIMTKDPRYRQAAIKGAEFIVDAQSPLGGWRYEPRRDSDTSVLGWQVMALHSVEGLGVKMPQETRRGAQRWLLSVTRSRHRMLCSYQASGSPTPSMTAEGVFSHMLLGKQLNQAEQDEACDYLLDNPPDKGPHNYYYWYYASLALMQLQNEAWGKWNVKMRDFLVELQRRGGNADGSWDPDSKYGRRPHAGRIYTTALATLTLEVYYRYLPMYNRAAGGGAKPE